MKVRGQGKFQRVLAREIPAPGEVPFPGDIQIPGVFGDVPFPGLPFIEPDDYESLPGVGGVYFVLSPGRTLYIGQAWSIWLRWSGHSLIKRRLRYEANARISWIVLEDAIERSQFELASIHRFKPLWNNRGAEYKPRQDLEAWLQQRERLQFLVEHTSNNMVNPRLTEVFHSDHLSCQEEF